MSDSESEDTLHQEELEEYLIAALVSTIVRRISDGETEWSGEDWDLWVRENSGGGMNAHNMYHRTTLWHRFRTRLMKTPQLSKIYIDAVDYDTRSGGVRVFIRQK